MSVAVSDRLARAKCTGCADTKASAHDAGKLSYTIRAVVVDMATPWRGIIYPAVSH